MLCSSFLKVEMICPAEKLLKPKGKQHRIASGSLKLTRFTIPLPARANNKEHYESASDKLSCQED